MKNRIIGYLMALVIIIPLLVVPDIVYGKSKGYLVLVHNDPNGNWTAYENLACASPKGNIMVKVAAISKLLELDYSTTQNGFIINDNRNITNKALTFTKGNNEYSYYDGKKTVKHEAVYKAYTSKDFNPSSNVIHFAALKDLEINVNYFKKIDMPEGYKALGFSGIICLSGYSFDSIESLPSLYHVVDTKGNAFVNLEPVGYNGTIEIGGVQIPKLDKFAESALADPKGVWGADVSGDRKLEQAMDDFSVQMRKDIAAMKIDDNPGENADIKVNDYMILAQINGDSVNSALRLYKTNSYYEIYISSRLSKNPNKNQADYSKIAQNALKLFCATVSSEPEKLFTAIYESAETDNTHGINKTTWVTIGDCQVKYRVEQGHAVIYQIKAK